MERYLRLSLQSYIASVQKWLILPKNVDCMIDLSLKQLKPLYMDIRLPPYTSASLPRYHGALKTWSNNCPSQGKLEKHVGGATQTRKRRDIDFDTKTEAVAERLLGSTSLLPHLNVKKNFLLKSFQREGIKPTTSGPNETFLNPLYFRKQEAFRRLRRANPF